MRLFILFACIFFGPCIQAVAQLSKAKVESLLTNKDNRNWVLKDYKKTLGNECTGDGQLFTFLQTGKVQRKHCVNNKIEFLETTWSLVSEGDPSDGEWNVVFASEFEISPGQPVRSLRVDFDHSRARDLWE